MRVHTIRTLGEELAKEGFTAFVCPTSGGCFDIVARSEEGLILIKVLQNIDGFTNEQASDLKNIAGMASAKPFIVGEQTKEFILEANTLYVRHGIPAVNLATFRQMVFERTLPEKRKFRKLGVSIDPEKLVSRRKELELTVEELSGKAGIGKKTLYRYEHGVTLADEKKLKKLEEILGPGIRRGIDPFTKPELGNTFEFHGFSAIEARAAPFQVLGKEEKKKTNKVMMGKEADKRTMLKRAETYTRISGIFESYSCFLVKSSNSNSLGGIPLIREEELQGLKKAKELLKLIEERGE
ncbi:MAG: helix-turn-helix domain-containing protein [Candidatus Micrarchaeota archaeon]